MRHAAIILMLALLATTASARETLQEMRAKADKAKPAECAKLCIKVARAYAEQSNDFFNAGKNADGHASMQLAFEYALRAAHGAIQSKKHEKHAEIKIRELIARIHDIGETLSFEDRAPIEAGLKQLETARTQLLDAMFGVPKKSMLDVLKEEEKKK